MELVAKNALGESPPTAGPPADGTLQPQAPELSGNRVLQLTSRLQTTLDINQQIEILHRELIVGVPADGLAYFHADEHIDLLIGERATHSATYALKLDGLSLGSIAVHRARRFTQAELQELENLLCALIYPLRNALRYHGAVQQASRDPLTDVGNRRAMEQACQREVDLAQRQGAPLSMIVFDIDHFKLINDHYGHDFGDEVIRLVAQTAATTIRRSDLLFRYGGEEFVVLTSHTAEGGACLLAERIRAAVEALHAVQGRDIAITISLGVALLQEDDDVESLFRRADHALYQAKHHGRNRTVCG